MSLAQALYSAMRVCLFVSLMSLFACLPPPDNFEDAQSVTPDAATQISGDANAAAADANDIDVNAEDAAIDVALTPDAGVATDAPSF